MRKDHFLVIFTLTVILVEFFYTSSRLGQNLPKLASFSPPSPSSSPSSTPSPTPSHSTASRIHVQQQQQQEGLVPASTPTLQPSHYNSNFDLSSFETRPCHKIPIDENKENCFALFVTSSNYLPCTAVSIHSIQQHNKARVKLLVGPAVDQEKAREMAQEMDFDVVPIDLIKNPNPNVSPQSTRINNFTKWRIWQLDETCKKVVYLDSDIILNENIEDLFEIESSLAASPNYETAENFHYLDFFNAGFLVLTPDSNKFNEMMNFTTTYEGKNNNPGDQPVLNAFWKGCWTQLDQYRDNVNGNIWFIKGSWPKPPRSVHYTRHLNACRAPSFADDLSIIPPDSDHPSVLWFKVFSSTLEEHPDFLWFGDYNPFLVPLLNATLSF